ncbi:MAG TPA: cation transporter [Polyangia bacterium]
MRFALLSTTVTVRAAHLRTAVRLETLTIAWNVVEGVVAVGAALLAGSVALLAFGIDSFVESAAAAIMLWRLFAERRATSVGAIEAAETRARKWIALSLFALAVWVLTDAGLALWRHERAETSLVGIALTVVSLAVMLWLARAKRRTAAALKSRALEADAFQTTACWWLSLAALVGLALNAALGWWWADPVAALVIVVLLIKEGSEAWKGEDSCVDCDAH